MPLLFMSPEKNLISQMNSNLKGIFDANLKHVFPCPISQNSSYRIMKIDKLDIRSPRSQFGVRFPIKMNSFVNSRVPYTLLGLIQIILFSFCFNIIFG